jgi:hypothetical protein
MTSEADSSMLNHTSLSQIDQRRQIIHHLVLLLHAHKCLQRERQSTTTSNDPHETTSQNLCTIPHCATMRAVLQHMTKCSDFKNCSCKFDRDYSKKIFFYLYFKLIIVFNLVILFFIGRIVPHRIVFYVVH